MCVLHMFLALVRHEWKHGLAGYIGGDGCDYGEELAEFINRVLSEKCGVCIDVKTVKDGMKQTAARAPRLPGAAARKVCMTWDLFLRAVLFWDDANEGDEDRKAHFRNSSACNDAILELWNCVTDKMPRDLGPDLPPSLKQRKKKAKLLGLKAARFRELYQEAYGPKAFKPYTHMTILTSGRRSSIANTV